ncbi:phage DNA invertase [Citrobacter freundii]|nr:phage DNA invertase [Citrobacter freundii]
MRIGYVRVSTIDQNPELQREAIERANCELIFEDKMTGTKAKRPGVKPLTQKVKTWRYGWLYGSWTGWGVHS